MTCESGDIIGCTPEEITTNLAESAAVAAWDAVCKSFADAAVSMLESFAKAFVAFPNVNLSSGGVRSVYGISLGIAGLVAVILLFFQIARTALTHDGGALAQGVTGVGKAALAFMVTLSVAGASLVAADELTVYIIKSAFGSTAGLEHKLVTVFKWSAGTSGSLLLVLAVIGIVLVTVLWFEMLLRNAAVAVLIATSPIAAAGQVSQATAPWWSKLVAATVRLIVLKPVIALVFALGFGITGNSQSQDIGTLLAGMLILLLAVLAWPAIARFFTFAEAHTGGATGLAAALGFAAGQGNAGGKPSGPPVGVDPDQFGQAAEARTMSSVAARTGGHSVAGSSAGASAGATGAAGGGAAAGGAVAAGVTVAVSKGLEMAQRAANSLVGRMEQTAGHAGLSGASPYAYPAGYSRGVPARLSNTAAPAPEASGEPPAEPVDAAPPSGEDAMPEAAAPATSSAPPPVEPAEATAHMPPAETAPSPLAESAGSPPVDPVAVGPLAGPDGTQPVVPMLAPDRTTASVTPATPPPSAPAPAAPRPSPAPAGPRPSAATPGPVVNPRPAPDGPVEQEKGPLS